jgi:hypothetical protein
MNKLTGGMIGLLLGGLAVAGYAVYQQYKGGMEYGDYDFPDCDGDEDDEDEDI